MFIINLCPTGMIPTKDMTVHVPITADEIAADVLPTLLYGVSMVHIHARDEQGRPIYKKDTYARIISTIRETNEDVIICVSTSGRNWPEIEKRAEVLQLTGDVKPDMASLTLSSLNFNKQASINEPDTIKRLASIMLDNGIKPELEVFDTGMLNYAHYLIGKGLLEPPYYFNLILGNVACAQVTPLALGTLIAGLPDQSTWSVGGVGDYQLTANVLGIACGGGVRVGLEDNIWCTPKRKALATNKFLVQRIYDIATTIGLVPATPREVRCVLQL
jgi:uncharacterized protein (DUF849 family)